MMNVKDIGWNFT